MLAVRPISCAAFSGSVFNVLRVSDQATRSDVLRLPLSCNRYAAHPVKPLPKVVRSVVMASRSVWIETGNGAANVLDGLHQGGTIGKAKPKAMGAGGQLIEVGADALKLKNRLRIGAGGGGRRHWRTRQGKAGKGG
jgi:hypothetical protein